MIAENNGQAVEISIHAPRTGSDTTWQYAHTRRKYFNPRSPHGERRDGIDIAERAHISIHAPRTGSDAIALPAAPFWTISIHAPRTGSDGSGKSQAKSGFVFQSTLPARGATTVPHKATKTSEFQSTLPARGATEFGFGALNSFIISIHAPRTGSDGTAHGGEPASTHFNPRSPHGERLLEHELHNGNADISIHAPRTGSDGIHRRIWGDVAISIHAPRTGSDGF